MGSSRLEDAKREAEALAYAEQRAAAALDELPGKHRAEWLREADADFAKARAGYEAAIRQLSDARDRLGDLAGLVHFLEHGQHGQPLSGAIQQPLSDGNVRALPFDVFVGLMLAEAAGVAEATRLDPNRPRPEPQLHRMHRA